MTPPPSPEMVERAKEITQACSHTDYGMEGEACDGCIALALTTAHAQGRAEGLEEAAKVTDIWRDSRSCDPNGRCEGIQVATSIGRSVRARAAEEARRG